MDISDVGVSPTTLGTAGATIIVTLLTIRRWISRDKVDRSLDAATVQLIQSLQAERDAANRRAAEADARADAALDASAKLQGEVQLLRFQVATLSLQVAKLTGQPITPSEPAA